MFERLKPSLKKQKRQAAQVEDDDNTKVVLDLDALLPQKIGFILMGQKHVVEPVTVEQFAVTYQKLCEIDGKVKKGKLKGDELYRTYAQAFARVCPSLTEDVIRKMNRTQVNAFFLFIVKILSGEAYTMPDINAELEKKN